MDSQLNLFHASQRTFDRSWAVSIWAKTSFESKHRSQTSREFADDFFVSLCFGCFQHTALNEEVSWRIIFSYRFDYTRLGWSEVYSFHTKTKQRREKKRIMSCVKQWIWTLANEKRIDGQLASNIHITHAQCTNDLSIDSCGFGKQQTGLLKTSKASCASCVCMWVSPRIIFALGFFSSSLLFVLLSI